MKSLHCPTPSGDVIFCDEVRFENTAKHLYIGVYTNEMIIHPSFPVRLRSIAAVVTFALRPNEICDLKIEVSYTGIEANIAELSITKEEIQKIPLPEKDGDDPEPYDPVMKATAILQMSDIVLPGPGKFKVLAHCGENVWRLGTMKVTAAPVAESTVPNPA